MHVIRRLNGEFGTTILLIEHRIDRVLRRPDYPHGRRKCQVRWHAEVLGGLRSRPGLRASQMLDLGRDLKRRIIGEIPLTVKEGRQLAPVWSTGRARCQPPTACGKKEEHCAPMTSGISTRWDDGAAGVSLNVRGAFAIIGRNARKQF